MVIHAWLDHLVPYPYGEVYLTTIDVFRAQYANCAYWGNKSFGNQDLTDRKYIVKYARMQIGEDYDANFMTQKGPDEWTCSGLTEMAYTDTITPNGEGRCFVCNPPCVPFSDKEMSHVDAPLQGIKWIFFPITQINKLTVSPTNPPIIEYFELKDSNGNVIPPGSVVNGTIKTVVKAKDEESGIGKVEYYLKKA
jgi:hypothetical protein